MNFNSRADSVVGAIFTLALVFCGTSTFAASDTIEASVIEEVIVTAERRSESVLDVPVTLTALSSSMIESLGITSADDLEQLVPGLQFGDNVQQQGQGTVMRGIGTKSAAGTHADLAVATYIDGVYTLGTYGVAPNFFDLERVEVARGPQGTLNGRNSIGGSVSYYTKKPTDEWEALVLTEFTDQFTQRYNVAFGGPLSDLLSFRINGGYYEGDGAQENIGFGDDYDAPDQISYSPQLRLTADRVDMNLRYSHVEDRGAPRNQVTLTQRDRTIKCNSGTAGNGDPDPFSRCRGVNGWFKYAGIIPSIDPDCPPGVPGFECGDLKNKVNLNRSGEVDSEADQIFYYADFALSDELSLRYNAGWSDVVQSNSRDSDLTNRVPSATNIRLSADAGVRYHNLMAEHRYEYNELSHELLLSSNFDGKFNFITGVFFYENDTYNDAPLTNFSSTWRFQDADEAAAAASPFFGFIPVASCQELLERVIGPVAGLPIDPAANPQYYYCPQGSDHTNFFRFENNAESKTRAVFLSGEYQLDERWLLSGGVRHTEDKKSQDFNGGFLIQDITGTNTPLGLILDDTDNQEKTWRKTIGNVSLEFTPNDEMMIYGRVSTGYRAGGFNTFAPGVPSTPIEEETLINYELGLKGLFLDQRLQLTAGAFYYDFDGYQLSATQEVPPEFALPTSDSPLAQFTANIDGTKLWGAEVELLYQLTDRIRISGYYSYLDSEIGSFSSVIKGDPNPQIGSYDHIDPTTGLPTSSLYVLATDQTGNQLPQQPNDKAAITLNYRQPLQSAGVLDFLTTWSYTGARHSDVANISQFELPAYDRWDIRATWISANDRWSTTLYVQNVLDEIDLIEFLPTGFGAASNPASGTLTAPRQLGLQLRYRTGF